VEKAGQDMLGLVRLGEFGELCGEGEGAHLGAFH
jgi:hypothetical protein